MNKHISLAVLLLTSVATAAPVESGNSQVVPFPSAFPKPANPIPKAENNFDHKQEQFFIHIPASYTGREPFGLIVFVDAGNSRNALPAGWETVLEQKKLLFIAPQNVGNDQNSKRRYGLSVAAALAMKRHYNIDRSKVYIAGVSGGARIAGALGFYAPDIFKGTIQSCGADFYKPVPKVAVTDAVTAAHPTAYGNLIAANPTQVAAARARVKFVFITGPGDYRHPFMLDIYNGGFKPERFQALFLDIEGMGHAICGAPALESALDFLSKP